MIGWYRSARTRWREKQVYIRVMEMLDEPTRGPGVARWLAKDPERSAIYRRVSAEVGRASDAASRLPELGDLIHAASAGSHGKRHVLLAATGLAVAAAAVAGVGLTVLQRDQPAAIDTGLIANGVGDRTIILKDGSKVTLEGPARLVADFAGRDRSIQLLAGSAIFLVTHDATRPFVVHAGGGAVTAIGTQFSVRVDGRVSVRLISGVISVMLPSTSPIVRNRPIRMTPGQQLVFDRRPENLPTPAADKVSSRTTFDSVPLSTVVAAVNRSSPARIVVDDPAVGERKVFAEIDISDAGSVAEKLAATLGLVIDRTVTGEIHLQQNVTQIRQKTATQS
ncbi:FecR domain-containing protein [Sphingomonas sp. BIUV-7]|uniref:FecR domain-containing protein n=1 Tax=Sphingomonas natans TaxID=3063330 RepID=A0ABT8YCK6_9SPHN|nr:FecR domain-containing protein [Sphingomonas sp. BIUV-7]MDO6415424.1 FecR domain-containing protein [Sphingomonas sp. BIUV-7]